MLEQPKKGRRVVLFPLPWQGHINPMLQLASILYSNGFSITIIHTQYNSVNHLMNYPNFSFEFIKDGFLDNPAVASADRRDVGAFMVLINDICFRPFHDCLAQLITNGNSEDPIACLITDAHWYFTQSVAEILKVPRMALWPSSISSFLLYTTTLPLLVENGYFDFPEQALHCDQRLPEFPTLKVKDIQRTTPNIKSVSNFYARMAKETIVASGIIWNSFEELEKAELQTLSADFPVPNFLLGPLHKYFPASASSILEQDQSVISWLDLQEHNSVLYVSFGSAININEVEFEEVASSLANTSCPFLWVVRPGLVTGAEWLELLPNGFIEEVGNRGKIVKWAPQQEVLSHPATGAFWTHNGWNSTLESICEGVPMICSPGKYDQPDNARYVSEVWKVGVLLENGIKKEEIGNAIKLLMNDEEGKEIRERIICLKEKVIRSHEKGSSSYQSLQSLVDHISLL